MLRGLCDDGWRKPSMRRMEAAWLLTPCSAVPRTTRVPPQGLLSSSANRGFQQLAQRVLQRLQELVSDTMSSLT